MIKLQARHSIPELSLVMVAWGMGALHLVAYGLSPMGSAFPSNTAFAALFTYLFVLSAVVAAGIRVWNMAEKPRGDMAEVDLLEAGRKALPLIAILAMAGLGAHAYAKLSALPSDGGGCLGELRNAFINKRETGSVVMRALSVAGHLLTSMAYPGTLISAYAIIRRGDSSGGAKGTWPYFLLFTGTICLYALLIVSRSVVLTLVGLAFFTAVYAVAKARAVARSRALPRALAVIAAIVSLGIVFGAGVTISQVHCGAEPEESSHRAYFDGYTDELPVRNRTVVLNGPSANVLDNPLINPALHGIRKYMQDDCPACGVVTLYLSHGIFNFEAIGRMEQRGAPLLLSFVDNWLQRIGLMSKPEDPQQRVHGRGGTGLVGAAYHDYGWIGVVLLGGTMGAAIVVIGGLLRSGLIAAIPGVTGFIGLGLTTLFSYMFVAPATMAFPFVIFSCVVVFVAVGINTKRSSYKLVS